MVSAYVVVVFMANISISVVGTFFNLLLIIAFIYRRHLRTPSNWFNLLLFVDGFLISTVVFPMQGLVDVAMIKDNPLCILFMSGGMCISTTYTMSTLALTVERYIAICYPLQATSIITGRRVAMAIGLIVGCTAFVTVFLPMATPLGYKGHISQAIGCRLATAMPNSNFRNALLGLLLIPVPCMIVIYCRIFFILRRHLRAVASLDRVTIQRPEKVVVDNSDATTMATTNTTAAVPKSGRDVETKGLDRPVRSTMAFWKKEGRSALLLFSLVMSFAICWVPCVVFIIHAPSAAGLSRLSFALYHALLYLNIAINPFIYGFGKREFRVVVKELFCRRLPSQHNADSVIRTMSTGG